jgi:hypothetical protein
MRMDMLSPGAEVDVHKLTLDTLHRSALEQMQDRAPIDRRFDALLPKASGAALLCAGASLSAAHSP